MPITGSFIESVAGAITGAVQPLVIVQSAYNQVASTSQSLSASYSIGSIRQYLVNYPINPMGYSGSFPVELTPLPTQSIPSSTIPTFGQLWPL